MTSQADPLANAPFFGSASSALRDTLRQIARRRELSPGEALFFQGDAGEALFVVERGLIEISILSEAGRKITLNVQKPGDAIGEIALFDSGPRTATAIATEPAVVSEISRTKLFRRLEERNELALEMIRLAGRRLRWMSEQFQDQVFLPAEGRLARRALILLARLSHDGKTLPLSQASLAEHVGVTREQVSKSLAIWKQSGWIEIGRGKITVLDLDALEALAKGGDA